MSAAAGRVRVSAVALMAGCTVASAPAVAQNWPEKPLRLVVPVPPGGSLDAYTRIIAQRLSDPLGQQVLVDNRPGANGIVGADLVAKAAPDGYTLLMGATPTLAINVTLYAGKLPYDPQNDFAAISMVARAPSAVAVNPQVPAASLKELVALARAQPGKLTYGTSGLGSGNHLATEMLASAAGIQLLHVPYSGGGPALAAVLSREVDIIVTPPPTLLPMVKLNRLRMLAVTSAKRSPALPEVPTIAEAGYPGFDATIWYCVVAPRGTPRRVIDRMNRELVAVVASSVYRERLLADAAIPESSTPEEAAAFVRAEVARWAKVIRAIGLKPS